MFSLNDVLGRLWPSKRPEPAMVPKNPAESGSHEDREEFEAWQRQWKGIQRSIDELVAHLQQDSQS